MADKKISALTASTTPLGGTEVLPIVQGGATVKVSVADLTAGRNTGMTNAILSNGLVVQTSAVNRWIVEKAGPDDLYVYRYNDAGGYAGNPVRLNRANGNVEIENNLVPNAGRGIDFGANTHGAGMTSELLNDYEEGTYTVAIGCGTSGTVTLNTDYDTAQYTKVGRLVTVTGGVIVSSVLLPLGYFTISLPFTSASLSELSGYFLSVLTISGVNTANIADFVSLGVNGASSIRVYLGDATGLQGDSAQELKAGTEMYFTISYIAA